MNLAHEVREILASLGYKSLYEIRGQADLLHLINHPSIVGQLDFTRLLSQVDVVKINNPVYLEADFSIDDKMIEQIKTHIINGQIIEFGGNDFKLNNRNKTVGGQTAIDIERMLSYEISEQQATVSKSIYTNQHGRRYLAPGSIIIRTTGSAGQSYAAFNNDGMRLEHTGTCNDGVGKSACGGVIVVKSPGGGSKTRGENVLIGNFALFGASGGKTFINGEAGDRFAVRNSGAMAVVEGVGDFACEYMINGAILNIGSFGKGFCTGMSGGNAYQYDPDNRLQALYDSSSVEIRSLSEETDDSHSHEQFILHMLEQHAEYANSTLAKKILNNWEKERQYFKFAVPLWLYKTQTARYIAEAMDRKGMIEELSIAYAEQQIDLVQSGYQNNQPLYEGETPDSGHVDTSLVFKLINSFSVIEKAQQIIKNQLSKSKKVEQLSVEIINQQAEKLIRQRPRKIQDALVKTNREAYSNYTDEQLAALMADKRLNDYKTAMIQRDVQSIYSIGSTAWIIEQHAINQLALAKVPNVEEYIAGLTSLNIVQTMLDEKKAA